MAEQRYIHPVQIGDVRLDNNLTLAPMAGFTNVAFRLIAKQVGGCGLVASEMVAALSPEARKHDKKFLVHTQNVQEEHPLAMQVYGREPELCARTAVELAERGADIVDLNCGCPVKKAKQAGCGVALMKEPEQVGRIIKAMSDHVDVPVTIKMRLGFDGDNRSAIEITDAAIRNGAVAVFVHGRTGESKHGMAVDYAGIGEVKDFVSAYDPRIPVFANGSMDTAENIRRAKDEAGADGYQIGRSACGDPWLFRNLIAELEGSAVYEPSLNERRALLEKHFDLIVDLFGEERGTRVMRKYTFFYCNGLPGVRKFRDRFMRIQSTEAFKELVADFFESLEQRGLDMGPAEHLRLFEKRA